MSLLRTNNQELYSLVKHTAPQQVVLFTPSLEPSNSSGSECINRGKQIHLWLHLLSCQTVANKQQWPSPQDGEIIGITLHVHVGGRLM